MYEDLLWAWGLISTSRFPLRVARGDDLLAELLLWKPQLAVLVAASRWVHHRMAQVGLTWIRDLLDYTSG